MKLRYLATFKNVVNAFYKLFRLLLSSNYYGPVVV